MPHNVSHSTSVFNAGPTGGSNINPTSPMSLISSVPSPGSTSNNSQSPYGTNGLPETPPPAYLPPDDGSQTVQSPPPDPAAMDTTGYSDNKLNPERLKLHTGALLTADKDVKVSVLSIFIARLGKILHY
ncbi:Protein of unknown function [Cotesia congregata]|uniref:Uncharacterized protein n=1 Tax=Cotesia congregata TaxID=51543 RepID=A0A8J2HQ92_COTCN|nr:Protein of unknown function [Cotesia congregata]